MIARFRSFVPALLIGGITCLGGAAGHAQAAPSDVVSLSPSEREAALEAGATRNLDALPINGLSRGVHGEVGAEIGSNGGRALYGTAAVPLGDSGAANFSFFTGQSGHLRPR